jgi:PhnB protein
MSEQDNQPSFTPEGWPIVTSRIVARDAEKLVEFIKQVFGGTGDYELDRPTTIRIGDSMILISEAGIREPMTGFFYVYVRNADETYRTALQAGATSMEEPSDTPYGDRRGMVVDPWGNTWQIATYRGPAFRLEK